MDIRRNLFSYSHVMNNPTFQIGILIPLVFFEVCWWLLAIRWDYFSLFPKRYCK